MNKQVLPVSSVFVFIVGVILFLNTDANAQTYEWEFDKAQKKKQAKSEALDSNLVHLKNKWEIKVSYGRWFFTDSPKSTGEEAFVLPGNLGLWQLTGAWHFHEQFFASLTIGLQLKRDVPTPDVFDVLNGNDIEIEGSGSAIIPIELGLKYYLSKKKFRPLVGISIGTVTANSRYIIAEGNLSNGFSQTEVEISGQTGFGQLNGGFDYRLGKYTSVGMNFAYYLSGKFREPIGGYERYGGLVINAGFAIVF